MGRESPRGAPVEDARLSEGWCRQNHERDEGVRSHLDCLSASSRLLHLATLQAELITRSSARVYVDGACFRVVAPVKLRTQKLSTVHDLHPL